MKSSPYAYYILMVAFGFHAYYGNTAAPLNPVLTKVGQKLLADVTTDGEERERVHEHPRDGGRHVRERRARSPSCRSPTPTRSRPGRSCSNENDPGQFKTASSVPLLIIQGGADEQIPVVTTELLYTHLCSLGQVAQRWIYPGQSHAGVIAPSFNDMVQWISDRFAGGPNPDPYVPTGEPGIVPVPQTCN